jgi:laccase
MRIQQVASFLALGTAVLAGAPARPVVGAPPALSVPTRPTTITPVVAKSSASKTITTSSSTSTDLTPGCTNGPTSRSCWGAYNIDTDYGTTWPNTGVTKSFTFHVTNTTLSPDGTPKQVLAVNGQIPGPTIEANWGDIISVQVFNDMQSNGTSLHWHGLRQLHSNDQDGVNGVTECALAPGDSKTYTFQATEYGTSWYHSHFSAQYGDGVLGPIIIHGPASANYDVDLGTVMVRYVELARMLHAISLMNSK